MLNTLSALENQLTPVEEIFFRWLTRVVIAATLAGSAWIDDAPPLELAALAITLYVVIRVVMQFGAFASAVPFKNQILKVLSALVALGLLGLSFLTVVTFVYHVAFLAAG